MNTVNLKLGLKFNKVVMKKLPSYEFSVVDITRDTPGVFVDFPFVNSTDALKNHLIRYLNETQQYK